MIMRNTTGTFCAKTSARIYKKCTEISAIHSASTRQRVMSDVKLSPDRLFSSTLT